MVAFIIKCPALGAGNEFLSAVVFVPTPTRPVAVTIPVTKILFVIDPPIVTLLENVDKPDTLT